MKLWPTWMRASVFQFGYCRWSRPREMCVWYGAIISCAARPGGRVGTVLRDYFAPGDLEAGYSYMVNSPHCRITTQTADEYLAEFDLLRRKAEGRV